MHTKLVEFTKQDAMMAANFYLFTKMYLHSPHSLVALHDLL